MEQSLIKAVNQLTLIKQVLAPLLLQVLLVEEKQPIHFLPVPSKVCCHLLPKSLILLLGQVALFTFHSLS